MIRNGIDSESGVEGLLARSTFCTVSRYAHRRRRPAPISLMGGGRPSPPPEPKRMWVEHESRRCQRGFWLELSRLSLDSGVLRLQSLMGNSLRVGVKLGPK